MCIRAALLVRSQAYLQLLKRHLLFAAVLRQQEACGLHCAAVVLHVQGDGAPCLGAATDMVELESCTHRKAGGLLLWSLQQAYFPGQWLAVEPHPTLLA
jgi:hypothetical protein